MRNFVMFMVLGAILIILANAVLEGSNKGGEKWRYYNVEVIYCDNRPSKVVRVHKRYRPTNRDISTYKEAVPKWNGELNVCEIKVLE